MEELYNFNGETRGKKQSSSMWAIASQAGGTVKKSYRIIFNTYTTAGSLSAINKWFVRFV